MSRKSDENERRLLSGDRSQRLTANGSLPVIARLDDENES
jgi:hypothetical protein